ncbi:MAG: glutamate racemase [Desulfohalobiaceae bacterium]
MTCAPIGVFDSGIGGLTVLAAIRRRLPGEDLLYVADSLHAPYGEKSEAAILKRCRAVCSYFVGQRAKAVVVACNTATAAAAAALRDCIAVPVIGVEPGLKPAAAVSTGKSVGILATAATLKSAKYAALVRDNGSSVTIHAQACPGLVELIEQGGYRGSRVRDMVRSYLDPLLDKNVDTIVLGCTHYPLIAPVIRELTQGAATVVETGEAVARHLENTLRSRNLLAESGQSGSTRICSTGPWDSEYGKLCDVLHYLGITGCPIKCDLELDDPEEVLRTLRASPAC